MELLGAAALLEGVEAGPVRRILECLTTEEALAVLKETGRFQPVMDRVMERICFYLDRRAGGRMQTECIMYAKEYGQLAVSAGARELLRQAMETEP